MNRSRKTLLIISLCWFTASCAGEKSIDGVSNSNNPRPDFSSLDSDGDGAISAEEFQGTPEEFRGLDKDNDGKLSPDELSENEGNISDPVTSPCDPNPCANGGVCSAGSDESTASCDCSSTGFEGESCESDLDECAATESPCDSNAICTNNDGGFDCSCNNGWEGDGKTCTKIDACASMECDANATCTKNGDDAACVCNEGWDGDGQTCTDLDECAATESPCDVNATCNNKEGGFACICNESFVANSEGGCDLSMGSNCWGLNTPCEEGSSCYPNKTLTAMTCMKNLEPNSICGWGLGDCAEGASCYWTSDLFEEQTCVPDKNEGDPCSWGDGACAEGLTCLPKDWTLTSSICLPNQPLNTPCGPGLGSCEEGSSCWFVTVGELNQSCFPNQQAFAPCGSGIGGCADDAVCWSDNVGDRLCHPTVGEGENCGYGIAVCDEHYACTTSASSMESTCTLVGLAQEPCGLGVGGCLAGSSCFFPDENQPETALCYADGLIGDPCGKDPEGVFIGGCIKGAQCKQEEGGSSTCVDYCKEEDKYGDGVCNSCIKPDADCYSILEDGDSCWMTGKWCQPGSSCKLNESFTDAICAADAESGELCGGEYGLCPEGETCQWIDKTLGDRKCFPPVEDGANCHYGNGDCQEGSQCVYTDTTFEERICMPDVVEGAPCGIGLGYCGKGSQCYTSEDGADNLCYADNFFFAECGAGLGGCVAGANCISESPTPPSKTICFPDVGTDGTCGYGYGLCKNLLYCTAEKSGDTSGICTEVGLVGDSCGYGIGGCIGGSSCYKANSQSADENKCAKLGWPGEACGWGSDGALIAACQKNLNCIDSVCVDTCQTENKYGDGTCDTCIFPDPDCY